MRNYMSKILHESLYHDTRKLFVEHFDFDGEYTIRADNVVDVDGDCAASKKLTRFPVTFGKITGTFDCSYCNLESLERGPHTVGKFFHCNNNNLSSLKGSPISVRQYFTCYSNPLKSLEYLPSNPIEIGFPFIEGLPLLRVLKYDTLTMFEDYSRISRENRKFPLWILRKYNNRNITRANILACQKELIDNGFEDNASW